jgi:hypothetical protein
MKCVFQLSNVATYVRKKGPRISIGFPSLSASLRFALLFVHDIINYAIMASSRLQSPPSGYFNTRPAPGYFNTPWDFLSPLDYLHPEF